MSFNNRQLKDATDFLWDLYASSLTADEMEPDYSPKFLQKMDMLHRKYRMQKVWKTAARCAAILLLTLAVFGGAVLTFSTNARAAFRNWFREITATGARYHFLNEPDDDFREYYKIKDIPEGYELLNIIHGQAAHLLTYGRNNEVMLSFSYTPMDASCIFVAIGDHSKECTVNGHPAEFYYDDKEGASSMLVWRDEETNVIFQLDGFLTMDEMISLAESVVPSARPLPVYQIKNLSEDYALQRELRTSATCAKVYKSSNSTIILTYTEMSAASAYITVNQYHTQTTVNGVPADFYYNCNGTAADLVWVDEDANLIFGLSAVMDMEQMVEIAESVTILDLYSIQTRMFKSPS